MHLKITFISDTHGKHNLLNKDLPGGDILIHAGDFMNSGYEFQTKQLNFLEWFNKINIYTDKIFIAGNHDRIFENILTLGKNNLPRNILQ
jgi:predicted phosphodiesterase